MRSLKLLWRNARGPGWTKRARWYEGLVGDTLSIRLNVEDELRGVNLWFDDEGTAREALDRFEAGASVAELMKDYRS